MANLGGNLGVVGKPIPTFLIAVHWSHFDIYIFLQTEKTYWKNVIFIGGHFGQKFGAKYVGQGHVTLQSAATACQSDLRDTHTHIHT